MKISTHHFGEVEYTEDLVINFNKGIFGFERLRKYLFIKTDNDLFYWLNSIEQPEIAFPLIGLRVVDDSYPEEKSHEAFGIVKMNKNPLDVTVNLKAPVYINQDDKSGYQKIIDDDKYAIDYKLFVEES